MLTFSQKFYKCRLKNPGDTVLFQAAWKLDHGIKESHLFVSGITQRVKCGTETELLEAARSESNAIASGDHVDLVYSTMIPLTDWVNDQYARLN